jgi:hypothetical protein
MKRYQTLLFAVICLSPVQLTIAQTSSETASALPRLVRFGGTVTEPNGKPLAGVAGITFTLYSEQTGGAPLWMETQNITADANGHYTALLGATQSGGLPAELFTSEQAHWVGVQVQGQPEQPRVLLVSAPYALKAGDAETIGGLPPSAFVLAVPSSAASGSSSSTTKSDATPETATDVTTTGGKADYLPLFSGAATIIDSVVYQSGTGSTAKIGINTTAPATTLDVDGAGTVRGTLALPAIGTATATAGDDSQPLEFGASVFNSGTSTAVPQTFELKAEPAGNDTATASGSLNLLYASGTAAPAETGLKISSDGLITFAAGQTFPGTGTGDGTVTSVASGAGLTGGPITSTGTLSIATGGVTNAMLAKSSLKVTAGTDLTGGGSVTLGGSTTLSLDTTKVPQLAASNTFTGSQTIDGSTYMIGSTRVDYSSVNKGTVSPGVQFGTGDTGEAISSDRAGTANLYGVDIYTDFAPRLSVTNGGNVGIGTTAPSYTLDVQGTGYFSSTTSTGVNGTTSAASFSGVNGTNTAMSGAAYGVYGVTVSPAGVGTYGLSLSSGGDGVYGETDGTAAGSTGVYGNAIVSTGTNPTYGVYGVSATIGIDNTGNGGGAGVAGTGPILSSTGAGVGGYAGVWGDSGGLGIAGVHGTADDNIAVAAVNSTGSDTNTASLLAVNDSTEGPALVFETASGYVSSKGASEDCWINAAGNLVCTGTISPSTLTTEGRQLKLYSVASPENWFEDFGSGQLSGGHAQIPLEPAFASTINTGEAYRVFLTPNGDSKGLYVAGKTAAGFEVREQGGGTSNISFDYRIVAKRLGYESVRLEDTTELMNKMRERQAQMKARGAGRKLSVPARPAKLESPSPTAQTAKPARATTLKAAPAPPK